MGDLWYDVCYWVNEIIGDFYSKVCLSTSTFIIWMGSLNWNMIFMVLGFLMGFTTMLINWYYKRRNSIVFAEGVRDAAEKGYVLNEPKE